MLSASDCAPERTTDGAALVCLDQRLTGAADWSDVSWDGPVLGESVNEGVDIFSAVRLRD